MQTPSLTQFFTEIERTTFSSLWKHKNTQDRWTVLNSKRSARCITFKLDYRATETTGAPCSRKTDTVIDAVELRSQGSPCTYRQRLKKFVAKKKKRHSGEMTAASADGAGQWDVCMEKNGSRSMLITLQKTQLYTHQGLQHMPRYPDPDRRDSGMQSWTHWHRREVLNKTLKAQAIRPTINIWDPMKMKTFYTAKGTIKWGEIAAERVGQYFYQLYVWWRNIYYLWRCKKISSRK